MDRTRRRAFLFAVATTAIACGIEVRGLVVPGDGIDSGVDPDAALDSNPANDANASDADADAPFDCGDGGGGFCDLCDETLLLCVPFEDEAKDQSRYNHAVIVLGQLGFVNGPAGHGRAMEIDAATTLRVAHNKAWEDHNALTIEMFIRINALPPDGGRAGLVDKNSAFGFFLQPNGDLACSVGPNLRGQPDGGLDGGRYTHVACVSGGGRSVLYARGVQLVEADSGSPSPSNEELAIAGNSPAGDPFIGSIDGLRIYKRAKTAKEIANDSLVFVTIDGGDAAVQQ